MTKAKKTEEKSEVKISESLVDELVKWINKKISEGKLNKFRKVLPINTGSAIVEVGVAVLESMRTGRPFPCIMLRVRQNENVQDFVIPMLIEVARRFTPIKRVKAEEEKEEEEEGE